MANSFLDKTGLGLVWAQIKLLLAGKVDKVDGKGLSSNDYTAEEKAKLANIAAGAEVNVNADWNAVTGDSAILNKPTIPTATSDLTNDSGFITTSDIPEGAAASTTTPAMDGTASIGTELTFARGDHVHPSDTSKVDKVAGKGLSTEDFTTAEKTKLAGVEAGAQANVNADWNAVSGDAQILNKPSIPSATSDLTNDSGFITAQDVPQAVTVDDALDSVSTNPVENQVIYNAFDTYLHMIDYTERYPQTNSDLTGYNYISYYVSSLSDYVNLYRQKDWNYMSIDGKYSLTTEDYGDTWTYHEEGSGQTYNLSHVQTGYILDYTTLGDFGFFKDTVLAAFIGQMIQQIQSPSSFDEMDDFGAISLYDSSNDSTFRLLRTSNTSFSSIVGNIFYEVRKVGGTWKWYKDYELQGNLSLQNVVGFSYMFAKPEDIPTNNNQLTNGAGYQTAANVNALIATAIGNLEGVSFEVVQTLPATGDKSKIYLVPLTDTDTDNIYEEYIWITSASDYEKIGTTSVDLSDYYNTSNLIPITSSEINTICQ